MLLANFSLNGHSMSSSWLMFFQPGCQSSNLRFGHLPTRGCKVQRNKAATLEAGHVGWSNQHVQSFSRRGGGYRMGRTSGHQVRCTSNLNYTYVAILDESRVWENLFDGHPLTAHLAPGDFRRRWQPTTRGHGAAHDRPAGISAQRCQGPPAGVVLPVGRCWHCGSGSRLSVLRSS